MTKDELIKARDKVNHFLIECGSAAQYYLENDNKVLYDGCLDMRDIYNTILQALDAQIKACDVPKIEGIPEILERKNMAYCDGHSFFNGYATIEEAARAYHKLTGGE